MLSYGGDSGVVGETRGPGVGVFAIAGIGGVAGYFKGNVEVTGDIKLLGPGSDCTEEFDIQSDNVQPGYTGVSNDGTIDYVTHVFSHELVEKGGQGHVVGQGNSSACKLEIQAMEVKDISVYVIESTFRDIGQRLTKDVLHLIGILLEEPCLGEILVKE